MGKIKNETRSKIRRVVYLLLVSAGIAAYLTAIVAAAFNVIMSMLDHREKGFEPAVLGGFIFLFLCVFGMSLFYQLTNPE